MTLHSFRTCSGMLLASALALPLTSQAANFKCVVDGKTAYQDRPCANEVVQRGAQSRIEVPVGGPSAVMMHSPAETAATKLKVEKDGVPKVREAFESLKHGNYGQYLTQLCPKARAVFQNVPSMMDNLKAQGAKYARDQVSITGLDEVTVSMVSLTAEDTAPKQALAPAGRLFVTGFIDWDLGKPCLSRMSVARRQK